MSGILVEKIFTKDGITKNDVFEGGKVVHVGCGKSKLKGSIGVDVLDMPAVDIKHDLNRTPWPFEADSVDVIFAQNVLEHVEDVVAFFNEAWRIGKNGSKIIISVPYFRNVDAFNDPTHKHFFAFRSLDYFLDEKNSLSNYQYSKVKFKKIGFWYGWPARSERNIVNKFKNFITRNSKFYDQYLSILFPVKILTWEIEVIK